MTLTPVETVLARFALRRHGVLAVRVMVLALLVLGACSVDRRSDEYRCSNPAECPSGMCQDGWCVPVAMDDAGAVSSDGAAAMPIDAAPQRQCPPVCSSCDSDTCFIECEGMDSCPTLIVCPADWDCSVRCSGLQSCAAGVRCQNATSCSVNCEGGGACFAGVICGAGACDVECSGTGACPVIDCGQSCACDTECEDGALCGVDCPDRGSNCVRNGQCSSAGCNAC